MEDYHPSIVTYYSDDRKGNCGYCSSKSSSLSYGLSAHILTVEDYQDMIDRGWRRCGHYCYKSKMDKTCCPLYTIRCSANDFKVSKTQKKIIKRFNHYLYTGEIPKEKIYKKTDVAQQMDVNCINHLMEDKTPCDIDLKSIDTLCVLHNEDNKNLGDPVQDDKVETEISTCSNDVAKESKPIKNKSQKAKFLRIERKKLKLKNLGLTDEEVARKLVEKKKYPVVKKLEDFLNESTAKNQCHNLKPLRGPTQFFNLNFKNSEGMMINAFQISLVRSCPGSAEFYQTFSDVFDLYKRYQISIHKDPPEKITKRQFERFLVESPLQINLVAVSSPEFKNTYNDAASLFAKYQKAIHNESDDDCDEMTFNGFLVESPLKAAGLYGSYHQQYWLDNKLIAVGVIDILPKCVSSVYFFYDPDYSFLSLGTYGALREVEFTRSLSSRLPDLKYYYMGFYIHSCVKMKYKAAFKPSFLLCPEAYTWHLVQDCLPKLNASKYSRLNDDLSAIDLNSRVSTSDVLIFHHQTAMSLRYYMAKRKCSQEDLNEIMEYAKLVGKICSKRILLYRMT